ncbi:PHP domain-containing protein [Candidatus Woesearchaeota archaeon]|jgi:3',5'-nucleoside bisphosphate phosphatase|nr:PHP domain-containing protein [Candidatus Woesearchaeota archaeon]MBT6519951.1 PHP domain-containing protein [Candidatus Woesearchaeota archaeon]MBT7367848.1 PHP domain-containing protein [Candidatus Woesearchaeota archaeon]
MKQNLKWDGHVHTYFSDGDYSPECMVKMAKDSGLDVICITDHDTVNGVARAIAAGNACGIKVISGVEVSSKTKSDLSYAGVGTHILGYGVDYKKMYFDDKLQQTLDARTERGWKQVEIYKENGIELDILDFEEGYLNRVVIGKARFLQKHGISVKDAMDLWGLDKSHKEIRALIDETGSRGFANVPYPDDKFMSPQQACDLVNSYGGVAVLAHPGEFVDKYRKKLEKKNEYSDKKMDSVCWESLVDFVTLLQRDHGLKGIEVYSSKNSDELTKQLELLAEDFGLIKTLGTDYHGLEAQPKIKLGEGIDNNVGKYNNGSGEIEKLINILN